MKYNVDYSAINKVGKHTCRIYIGIHSHINSTANNKGRLINE